MQQEGFLYKIPIAGVSLRGLISQAVRVNSCGFSKSTLCKEVLINQPGFLTKAHPADLSLQSSTRPSSDYFFSYAVLQDKIGVGEKY